MIPLVLVPLASAGEVEGLQPAVAPNDVAKLFADAGKPAPACAPLLPDHAVLCFRYREAGKRRWVTASELEAWKTDVAALREQITRRGPSHLRGQIERLHVEGMPADGRSSYVRIRDGEGWIAAALLDPSILSEALGGGRYRVAVPRAGVLFAWSDPDRVSISPLAAAELDRILLVAVREAYEGADDAVTAMAYRRGRAQLEPFGQATLREESRDQP